MFGSVGEFFSALVEARLDFAPLWQLISDTYYAIAANPDMQSVWSAVMRLLEPVGGALPYILLLLSFAVAFFGKKIIALIKFVFFFILGFSLGLHFITPWIADTIAAPGWVCGLVIAIVAATLYRTVYMLAYILAGTYCLYMVFYNGFYAIPRPEFSSYRAVISLVFVLIAVMLTLLVRKYIEMLGTSVLGGYFVALVLRAFLFDYREVFLSATPRLATFVITFVIAIPAFIVQFRTRRKYR